MPSYMMLSECVSVSEWKPEMVSESASVRHVRDGWAVDCSGVRFHTDSRTAALELAHSCLTLRALEMGLNFSR